MPVSPPAPTTPAVDDAQLLAALRAGDASAERAFYDRHVDRVYRLAYRLTGDEAMAQDCTQDAFVRAFQSIHAFRGESALGTWLHSIASSVALNALRSRKRLRAHEHAVDELPDVAHPRREAEPDLKRRLHAAIDALPDGYRAVFVMHDVEGFTHEEIGTALGIQTGTSKAQLFRARQKLRLALADFEGEWT